MTQVYYKTRKGEHSFYLSTDGKDYYLFTQGKRKGVGEFFRGGVTLDRALHHGVGKRDYSLHKTMDKLLMQIQYVEKENDLVVLRRTRKGAA